VGTFSVGRRAGLALNREQGGEGLGVGGSVRSGTETQGTEDDWSFCECSNIIEIVSGLSFGTSWNGDVGRWARTVSVQTPDRQVENVDYRRI